MFSEASNLQITGGTFGVVNMQGANGFERLQRSVAPSAFHDAEDIFDPPTCHSDIRIAIISKIMDWILGVDADNQNAVVLWFYGPAEAGKSVIAYNIAKRCDLENLLLASFFFSRSDPTRNNTKSLIATISYQIAVNIPGTRERIVAAIERDPLVLNRSLEAQVLALVVYPLRELLEEGSFNTSTSRRLIIIDGLDECGSPAAQCKVLDVISLLFHKHSLPLLLLVASRPEWDLHHCFNSGPLSTFRATLAFDNTANNEAPCILEVPKGHMTYDLVEKYFTSSWRLGKGIPIIQRIYKVIENEAFLEPYDKYKEVVGNEAFRFHGTIRKCTLGVSGNTKLCGDTTCPVCSILKTSFKVSLANPACPFGAGVYCSSASNKAYSYTHRGTRAIFLTKVILGNVRRVHGWKEVETCPAGFNSVVFDRQNGILNETVVYLDDAIRPMFLIIFRESGKR